MFMADVLLWNEETDDECILDVSASTENGALENAHRLCDAFDNVKAWTPQKITLYTRADKGITGYNTWKIIRSIDL